VLFFQRGVFFKDWTCCSPMSGYISEVLNTISVKMGIDDILGDVVITGEYIPDIMIVGYTLPDIIIVAVA
jgi:hypothetical protein